MTPLYLLYEKIWSLAIKPDLEYAYHLFFFLEELPSYPFQEFSHVVQKQALIDMRKTYLNQDFMYVLI